MGALPCNPVMPNGLLARYLEIGDKKGWAFTPVKGKQPFRKGWNTEPRLSLEELKRYRGNVALRTGCESGIVVVDVDDLAALEILRGRLPETVEAITGGGGRHLYYGYNGSLPNSVGRLADGVDIRADGGCAVFPGSIHPDTGETYRWADGRSPDEIDLAPLPEWVVEAVTIASAAPGRNGNGACKGLDQVIAEQVQVVRDAHDGGRNDTLNKAAFFLGCYTANGYLDKATAVAELLSAAMDAGLPSHEAKATIHSGLAAGEAYPRTSAEPDPVFVDLARWLAESPPPIEYLFEGMIARKALVLLTGMGGLGKSGVLLTLVVSATIGLPLFSSFQPTGCRRVLWLCSEDDAEEVWRRFTRLCDAYGLDEIARCRFIENCRLFCVPGKPLVSREGAVTPWYRWLAKQVAEFKPDLVVLDPLCHFHRGDENSNAEMAELMCRLRDLSVPHGAAVLAVHHVGKTREREAESAAARGASSIRDGARAMFSLVPLTDKEYQEAGISNPKLFVRLEHSKSSWTPLMSRPVYLKNEGGVWREVDLATQREEGQHEVKSRIAKRIAELLPLGDASLTVNELLKSPTAEEIRDVLRNEFGKSATREALRDVVNWGMTRGEFRIETVKTNGRKRSVLRGLSDNRTVPDSRCGPEV